MELKKSVFHDLPNFHIYENLTCDITHDLSEGVHRYDMAMVIKSLIKLKYFSLDHLNNRIKYFNYAYYEKNKPPTIKSDNLNNGCIVCSSAEMSCLVRNFKFMVGDSVPENDSIWGFYLILLQITEILTSPSISQSLIQLLITLIEEHHSLYISLFQTNLKPKFHFLIHYPRIIKKNWTTKSSTVNKI